jgi:CDP-diacylglycerol---glycerol-3-phosphate 3-phosphatidyltransferase
VLFASSSPRVQFASPALAVVFASPTLAMLAAVVLLALGSMVVFALRGRRTDADAQRKGASFLLGAGDFLVHWLMWLLSPAERLFVRLRLPPDLLNFAGLLAGLVGGIAIATGRLGVGGIAIIAGGLCDVLDGRLARALARDSAYGKFIDSTLDRFVEVFALLGFAVYLGQRPPGPFLAAAAIGGSLLVSYTRARGESLGVTCKEGLMQRGERLVLTCAACLLDEPLRLAGLAPGTALLWAAGLIAFGTFLTAIYRTYWISKRLRAN